MAENGKRLTSDEPQRSGRVIHVRPRYYRLYTDPRVELAEENFRYAALEWQMPFEDAALVCLDVWNLHFAADTLQRTDDVTRRKIAPLVASCRRRGMQVIHAPASPVAQRHPNWVRLLDEGQKPQPEWPDSPEWPPPEFRRKEGRYAQYARPVESQDKERNKDRTERRDFHPAVRPEGDEAVILSGEELHRLCAERGIVILFYAGFHTNACIVMRDYGVLAMMRRGYNVVLVRDCTTGMETYETRDDLICTRGQIASLEQFGVYTITSEELIEALSVRTEKQSPFKI